jgi:hypothetical protein
VTTPPSPHSPRTALWLRYPPAPFENPTVYGSRAATVPNVDVRTADPGTAVPLALWSGWRDGCDMTDGYRYGTPEADSAVG